MKHRKSYYATFSFISQSTFRESSQCRNRLFSVVDYFLIQTRICFVFFFNFSQRQNSHNLSKNHHINNSYISILTNLPPHLHLALSDHHNWPQWLYLCNTVLTPTTNIPPLPSLPPKSPLTSTGLFTISPCIKRKIAPPPPPSLGPTDAIFLTNGSSVNNFCIFFCHYFTL